MSSSLRCPPRARALARRTLVCRPASACRRPCPRQAAACPSPTRARWPCLRGCAHLSATAALQAWPHQSLRSTRPAPSGAPTPRSEVEPAHVPARLRSIAGEPPRPARFPQAVAQVGRALLHPPHGPLRGRHPHPFACPWPHGCRDQHDTEIGTCRPFAQHPRAPFCGYDAAHLFARFSFWKHRTCPEDSFYGDALLHRAPHTSDAHASPVAGASGDQNRLSAPRSSSSTHHYSTTLDAEITSCPHVSTTCPVTLTMTVYMPPLPT
jgi:hypothetical protein